MTETGPNGIDPDKTNDYTGSGQDNPERNESISLQANPDQSRTINDANTLINSIDNNTTAETLNNQLDAAFLENLQNGLSPDDANLLRTKLEGIKGYNEPNTPLNNVYKYIKDISDAFGNQQHTITNEINVNEFLDNAEKAAFMERINHVEYLNLVAKDEALGNVLTAIKGIINGERVSGNTLAKIADYLGISTGRDSRYETDRHLDNLGERIFSLSDTDGLYIRLQTEYDQLTQNNEEIRKFIEDPFSQFSLKDLCKKLIGIEWNGGVLPNNQQVKNFCKFRGDQNADIFVNNFNEKNTQRIEHNKVELTNFHIYTVLGEDLQKISINNNNKLEIEIQNGDTTQRIELTAENIIEQLGLDEKAKAQLEDDPGQTDFISEDELLATINADENKNIREARLNQITEFVQLSNRNTLKEEISGLVLNENSILTKLFRDKDLNPTKQDIVQLFNNLKGIEINEEKSQIIKLLHKGLTNKWENKAGNTSYDAIIKLQTIIKGNNNDNFVDGKFGIKTFNAVNDIIEQKSDVDKRIGKNLKAKEFENTSGEYNLKRDLGLGMDTDLYTREGYPGVYYKNNDKLVYMDGRCFVQTLSNFSKDTDSPSDWTNEYPTNCPRFNKQLNGIFDNAIKDLFGETDHNNYSITFDNDTYYVESYGIKTQIALGTLTSGWVYKNEGNYEEGLKENFKILNLLNYLSSKGYTGKIEYKENSLYLDNNKLEDIKPFDNGEGNYKSLDENGKNALIPYLNRYLNRDKNE